jgi:hypothetical protein
MKIRIRKRRNPVGQQTDNQLNATCRNGKLVPAGDNAGSLFTPAMLAQRWHWHPESVRRKLRNGDLPSIIISRRRLIREVDVIDIEAGGLVNAVE